MCLISNLKNKKERKEKLNTREILNSEFNMWGVYEFNSVETLKNVEEKTEKKKKERKKKKRKEKETY